MDGDISEKLRSVLSDPAAMARISEIASGLGGSAAPQPESGRTPDPASDATDSNPASFPAPTVERDPRVALLYSLKPLLREEKRGKIDDLARAMSMITLLGNRRK